MYSNRASGAMQTNSTLRYRMLHNVSAEFKIKDLSITAGY